MAPDQGWYPDPEVPGSLRWWDGAAWTDFRAAPTGPTPPAANPWPPPYPTSPAAPRRRAWPWIVGSLVVLTVIVGVAGGIIIPKIVDTVTAPVDAANEYLAGTKLGGTPESYDRLCSTTKSQLTYSEYRRELAARIALGGRLESYDVTANGSDIGRSRVTVDVDIVTSRGWSGQIEALMQKQDGRWRWCGWAPKGGSQLRPAPFP